jgi:hypothetical protein
MMARIVGDENQVSRLGAGQIAGAPRIDLDDEAAVLDLQARVE